jgi:hypothetical protein
MDLQSAMETFAAWANVSVKQPFNLMSTNGPQVILRYFNHKISYENFKTFG